VPKQCGAADVEERTREIVLLATLQVAFVMFAIDMTPGLRTVSLVSTGPIFFVVISK
jgi:hypothetical protein